MLDHALAPVRRDDAELDAGSIGHPVLVGEIHRSGVEGGDLVVVQVGGDEGLGGEAVGDVPDMSGVESEGLQARGIGREIVAHRGHDDRLAAQQLQAIGDVAGAAAILAAHVRHQERHVQDMDLFGQDMVLELVVEHHDGVEGHGTADECAHRESVLVFGVRAILAPQGGKKQARARRARYVT